MPKEQEKTQEEKNLEKIMKSFETNEKEINNIGNHQVIAYGHALEKSGDYSVKGDWQKAMNFNKDMAAKTLALYKNARGIEGDLDAKTGQIVLNAVYNISDQDTRKAYLDGVGEKKFRAFLDDENTQNKRLAIADDPTSNLSPEESRGVLKLLDKDKILDLNRLPKGLEGQILGEGVQSYIQSGKLMPTKTNTPYLSDKFYKAA
ncbi:MAG: hypothetical protein ACMXX7_01455 [Candidatus Woesearchaeota archaeon]